MIMLTLEADAAQDAVTEAVEAGDSATALLMTAQMQAKLKEAREINERLIAQ